MDKKRLLRSPLVWIAVVLVIYLMYSYFADETRGYLPQSTSVALAQLKDGNVTQATIDDKEQRLRLDLTNPVDGSTKIYTSYPADSGNEIFNDVQAANISGGYDTVVTSESTLFSLLIYLIPVGLIILFLLWMMNNAQGGGNKVLSFGKSKAKLLTKDMPVTKFTDVAGADEAVRSSTRSATSWPTRPGTRRWAPRSPRVCCCTARPAPGRRCWRARSPARPACRSTRSPARTSSRCSSASAPPGSATCSSRPRPTRRPSSSSTRSTPSAGTAAPAWAAATTSASKR